MDSVGFSRFIWLDLTTLATSTPELLRVVDSSLLFACLPASWGGTGGDDGHNCP